MRRQLVIGAVACVLLLAIGISSVFANPSGIIVITPQWPTQQSTPATFTVSTNAAADPTYDPWIVLVMTVASYDGLSAPVTVVWSGGSTSFAKAEFNLLTGSSKIPDESVSKFQYERASLASHLYVSGEPVYWAMKDFMDGPLTTTPESFTVTIPSSSPAMLIYVLGKSSPTAEKFDTWVPPTNAGFETPDLAPIFMTAASFIALAVYAVKRKKL